MLFDDKRRALRRALAGALLGMAGGGLAAWAASKHFIHINIFTIHRNI